MGARGPQIPNYCTEGQSSHRELESCWGLSEESVWGFGVRCSPLLAGRQAGRNTVTLGHRSLTVLRSSDAQARLCLSRRP